MLDEDNANRVLTLLQIVAAAKDHPKYKAIFEAAAAELDAIANPSEEETDAA